MVSLTECTRKSFTSFHELHQKSLLNGKNRCKIWLPTASHPKQEDIILRDVFNIRNTITSFFGLQNIVVRLLELGVATSKRKHEIG